MSIGAMTMRKLPALAAGTRGRPPDAGNRLVATTGERVVIPERGLSRDQETQAQVLATALAQPHRRYSRDPRDERLGTALGRFCVARRWYGGPCWQAGQRYGEIVKEARSAIGLGVYGWAPGEGGFSGCAGDCPREFCGRHGDECRRAKQELAMSRIRDADSVLRWVMPRLPAAMERLTYHDLDPLPNDGDMLAHGLVRLALEWKYLDPQKLGIDNPE